MTSQIESSRRHYYTPLEEKQLFESRNKSMEITGIIYLYYSALWSNLAQQFFNISAIFSQIQPSGFSIFRPSGLGLPYQFAKK